MDTVLAPILLFLIFAGTTYYILVPFLSARVLVVGDETNTRATALELRKISLFRQVREVEFEREMGLTNQEDFERTRTDLVTEAAGIMRSLEGAPQAGAGGESPPAPAVAASTCPSCQNPVAPGARFCTHCGTELGSSCPRCGAESSLGDRFCTSCGRGLLN